MAAVVGSSRVDGDVVDAIVVDVEIGEDLGCVASEGIGPKFGLASVGELDAVGAIPRHAGDGVGGAPAAGLAEDDLDGSGGLVEEQHVVEAIVVHLRALGRNMYLHTRAQVIQAVGSICPGMFRTPGESSLAAD